MSPTRPTTRAWVTRWPSAARVTVRSRTESGRCEGQVLGGGPHRGPSGGGLEGDQRGAEPAPAEQEVAGRRELGHHLEPPVQRVAPLLHAEELAGRRSSGSPGRGGLNSAGPAPRAAPCPPGRRRAGRGSARPGCCAGSRRCRPRSSWPGTAGRTSGTCPAGPTRPEHLGPAHRVVVADQGVGAQQVDAELEDALVDLGEHQLGDRALGPGVARPCGSGTARMLVRRSDLHLDPQLHEPVPLDGGARGRRRPGRSGPPRRSTRSRGAGRRPRRRWWSARWTGWSWPPASPRPRRRSDRRRAPGPRSGRPR